MINNLPSRPRERTSTKSTMQGLTLVEILVATSIGLIILAAVSQIFVTSRSTFTLEGDLARLQENGRFSMEFIGQDLRMSGNLGCLQKYSVLGGTIVDPVSNQLNNNTDYGWDFTAGQHLRGHTYTGTGTGLGDWTPALPGTINGLTYFSAGDVAADSDVLVIRRAAAQSFKLVQATLAAGPVRIPDPGAALAVDDFVLITDCNGGDIFEITGITTAGPDADLAHAGGAGTPGNVATNLSQPYGINSEVSQVVTRIYYVGPGTDGVTPTLYRKDISSGAIDPVPQPLVDNVEVMRVLYGEDTNAPADNEANIYREANDVLNWTDVVSVRIALLVRTDAEAGPDFDTKTYSFAGGAPFGPINDRRQRRVFTSTIQLRNPIPTS